MIRVKRAYDPPSPSDGQRILVERLGPRGLKKEALRADGWVKDVAPSTALRKWFGHRPERWEEFRRRYREELGASKAALASLLELGQRGTLTLLYSAHDTLHNSAVALAEYLGERAGRRAPRSRRVTAARRDRTVARERRRKR
jgi:uncharacterized protein YeaO (DUF488 family)